MRVIWKLFVDFEKEEKWLNEMSAKGFALTDYFLGHYKFAECKPGEYTYRIELLENLYKHQESQDYIRFMEENGVEFMVSWGRWTYFRKKTDSPKAPFNIFSDLDSKITHYKRISRMFLVIGLSEIMLSINQFSYFMDSFTANGMTSYSPMNLFLLILLCTCAGLLLFNWNSIRKKIKKLNEEKLLRE